MKSIRHACCIALLLLTALSGCAAVPQKATKSLDEMYPDKMAPDAPLVLAIPGLYVSGMGMKTQMEQFGNLVEILADKGIPCRLLSYDTPANPLTSKATIGFDETNIAETRVGPSIIYEIQNERVRRLEKHLPPLKEVVLFSYSQGAVIANRIMESFTQFKSEYMDLAKKYGVEWAILQKDPEFLSLMDALSDYLLIRNIRIQSTGAFMKDPELRRFYRRAKQKLNSKKQRFLVYLQNPGRLYPQLKRIDTPESAKYPKKYPKFKQAAEECFLDSGDTTGLKGFFADYLRYKRVMNLRFRFISTAGSYMGSPAATNSSFQLDIVGPMIRNIFGKELKQIHDTRLGSTHQQRMLNNLLKLKGKNPYPYAPKDTLFILGANDGGGDGYVDQFSGHLSRHALASAQIKADAAGQKSLDVSVERLPALAVLPLPVKHFPDNSLLGGHANGAAYMEPGNPVVPYLLAFLRKDWKTIDDELAATKIKLQQFMIQISFDSAPDAKYPAFEKTGTSGNIEISRQYSNADAGSVVWTGKFNRPEDCMNLAGEERACGSVFFTVWRNPEKKFKVEVPVFPGCTTLLKVKIDQDIVGEKVL